MLIAASGTVLGKALIDANAAADDAKVALYNQLFQTMGDKFLEIVLSADKKNDYNTLSEFEKRKQKIRCLAGLKNFIIVVVMKTGNIVMAAVLLVLHLDGLWLSL